MLVLRSWKGDGMQCGFSIHKDSQLANPHGKKMSSPCYFWNVSAKCLVGLPEEWHFLDRPLCTLIIKTYFCHFRSNNMASGQIRNPVPDYCDGCVDWDFIIKQASNMALGKAAKKDCLECVNAAIAAGADVNTTVENTGNTALFEASKKGNISSVKALVQAGADVNTTDRKSGNSALLEAAKEGHFNCVQVLLEAGADVNNEDNEQRTALMYAAMNHASIQCLEALIGKGADVNKQDVHKITPLFLASYNGHQECVSLLVKAGANVTTNDKFNQSALFYALQNGHDKCSEILIEAGADVNLVCGDISMLMLVVEKGKDRIVSLLLQAGADVNRRNKDRETALIYAAEQGNICLLNKLIQAGADVNMMFQDDETALMVALIRGHTQSAKQLIDAGAEVNAKSRRGESALSYALKGGHDDCTRLMIEAGADGYGNMLLHKLVSSEAPGSFVEHGIDFKIKSLLRAGAKVDTNEGSLLTSCLKSLRKKRRIKELALLLFASGEKLNKDKNSVPDYLEPPKRRNLKYRCRDVIRGYLLEKNIVNLFYRVPKLGLPPALSRYLLYEQNVTE